MADSNGRTFWGAHPQRNAEAVRPDNEPAPAPRRSSDVGASRHAPALPRIAPLCYRYLEVGMTLEVFARRPGPGVSRFPQSP